METHGIDDAYGDDDEGSWPSMLLYLSWFFVIFACKQENKWKISTKNMDINKDKWKSQVFLKSIMVFLFKPSAPLEIRTKKG